MSQSLFRFSSSMPQCIACSRLPHSVPHLILPSTTAIKMSTDIYRMFPCTLKRWYDSWLFSCHFIGCGCSIEEQMVKSRAPEIGINLQMYLCVSFHCSGHILYLSEQMGSIAATNLVWTAAILNGSKVNGRPTKIGYI